MKKISRDELLAELHRLADETGSSPTTMDLREQGQYSEGPYRREFGNWNNALEVAGYSPNRNHGVTREEIKRRLQTLASILGRSPRKQDLGHVNGINPTTCRQMFGSWTEALIDAGLEPNNRPPIDASCEWCGERFEKYVWQYERSDNHYCSIECRGLDERTPDNDIKQYGTDWRETRLKIIERDGERCIMCGLSREEHQERWDVDLTVHHINPRREYVFEDRIDDQANASENLVTLCLACHAKVESWPVRPQLSDSKGLFSFR